MAVAVAARRLSRLLGAAVLLACTAGMWAVSSPPAHAATTHTVEVENRGGASLHPVHLDIHVGDTVVWTWVANEHHDVRVTGHGRHACAPDLFEPAKSCTGHTLEVTFEEAGDFRVRDHAGFASSGWVTVTTPPPPKPTPTPSPTPSSPSPTATASEPAPSEPAPSESSPSEPAPTESSEPEAPGPSTPPPPPPTEPPPPPGPTAGTAAQPPVDTGTAPDQTPTVGDPSVASADDSPSPVPAPTFDDFPDPVDPTPVDDVSGEVALGAPDDGGPARMVWGLVGGATLLGTLGAFGRSVLFSEPWDA